MAAMMGLDPQQQKAKAASTKKGKADDGIYGEFQRLRRLYTSAPGRSYPLVPLLPRHPALAKLVKEYVSASDNLYAEAKREVEEMWKVNPDTLRTYASYLFVS